MLDLKLEHREEVLSLLEEIAGTVRKSALWVEEEQKRPHGNYNVFERYLNDLKGYDSQIREYLGHNDTKSSSNGKNNKKIKRSKKEKLKAKKQKAREYHIPASSLDIGDITGLSDDEIKLKQRTARARLANERESTTRIIKGYKAVGKRLVSFIEACEDYENHPKMSYDRMRKQVMPLFDNLGSFKEYYSRAR